MQKSWDLSHKRIFFFLQDFRFKAFHTNGLLGSMIAVPVSTELFSQGILGLTVFSGVVEATGCVIWID